MQTSRSKLRALVESIANEEMNAVDLEDDSSESERTKLIGLYDATYQDKFKVKPRRIDWSGFTADEVLMMIDDLLDDDSPPPGRIPLKGGDEVDALSKNHLVHSWRPGQRKAAKSSYNRRVRRSR